MKYDIYDYCVELLLERGVTVEAMAELVLFSQKNIIRNYPLRMQFMQFNVS